MTIRNNIAAMTAYRHYQNNLAMMNRAALRISTGYRINSAADDPAGLAISEKMRAQIRGLNRASRNVKDAISLVQTAEGYMQSVCDILNRMTELSVQAATDTYGSLDRNALSMEFEQLKQEINDIAKQARYNDRPLLGGLISGSTIDPAGVGIYTSVHDRVVGSIYQKQTDITIDPSRLVSGDTIRLQREVGNNIVEYSYTCKAGDTMDDIVAGLNIPSSAYSRNGSVLSVQGTVKTVFDPAASRQPGVSKTNNFVIQTGPNQGDQLAIAIPVINTTVLGLDGVDISTRKSASAAISAVEGARKIAVSARGYLGAMQNRLEHKYNNLTNQALNLTDAESRIRDADMAQEMTNFVKYSILTQVSTMVMAHLNARQNQLLWLMQASLGLGPTQRLWGVWF